jgi:hypothetical protein
MYVLTSSTATATATNARMLLHFREHDATELGKHEAVSDAATVRLPAINRPPLWWVSEITIAEALHAM